MDEHVTKQEQRKLEHADYERSFVRKQFMRRFCKWSAAIIIVGGVLGYFVWFVANQPVSQQEDIISPTGIHWHPHLSIRIKGKEEVIPADIGLIPTEQPLHTHEADGVVHLEYFNRQVTKQDTELGKFFQIWGKRLTSECIFDYCNGQEGRLRFLVNGVANDAFEHYAMHDNDKIEIIFE